MLFGNKPEQPSMEDINDVDIDAIIQMLDTRTQSGVSRIGIQRVETEREDFVREVYHHGRCDVGSPFADGTVGNAGCDY